jgi:hypothetical protein
MEQLGAQLDGVAKSHAAQHPIELPLSCSFPRNLLFMVVVLFHGFRRLFPPY